MTQLSSSKDEKSFQCLRMYISAKEFYDKVMSDKKAKDKKNRRAEQVMTQGSKLTQNMAVTILLGAINVSQTPVVRNTNSLSGSAPVASVATQSNANDSSSRSFVLNIKPIDGLKFECKKPSVDNFIPFTVSDKIDRKERNVIRRFSTDHSILSDKITPTHTILSGKDKDGLFRINTNNLLGPTTESTEESSTNGTCTAETSIRMKGFDSCSTTLEIPLFCQGGDAEVRP